MVWPADCVRRNVSPKAERRQQCSAAPRHASAMECIELSSGSCNCCRKVSILRTVAPLHLELM
jgi:hypothetical protein